MKSGVMTGLVLPDANVLFSRTLRDWLFLLAHRGRLYTVHSTEDILAETMAKYRIVNSAPTFILVKS